MSAHALAGLHAEEDAVQPVTITVSESDLQVDDLPTSPQTGSFLQSRVQRQTPRSLDQTPRSTAGSQFQSPRSACTSDSGVQLPGQSSDDEPEELVALDRCRSSFGAPTMPLGALTSAPPRCWVAPATGCWYRPGACT